MAMNYLMENKVKRVPFSRAEDAEFSVEDKGFICKITELDPRDRSTVEELLRDKWFDSA